MISIRKWLHIQYTNALTPLWLYTASFLVLILLILTLSSALPIDVIVQSKTNNSHLATNTVIILVICVVFLLYSPLHNALRLLYDKMQLQDIPLSYIPISENDIGKSMARTIENEMLRTRKIREFAKPNTIVSHPGLFHRYSKKKITLFATDDNLTNDFFTDSTDSELGEDNNQLPDNLIYENVVNIIGQELKYNNTLTVSNDRVLRLDNHYSLRELLNLYAKEDGNIEAFLDLYEKLRFSGEPILNQEFKDFLKLWNYVKNKL